MDKEIVSAQLSKSAGELSGILFFLMGAMAVAELIDAHDGFNIISGSIHCKNKRTLLWIISCTTFFLSPVPDNLTTVIVMISTFKKFINEPRERLYFSE